eukprot:6761844-Pyramimonas_sp.AAC.1
MVICQTPCARPRILQELNICTTFPVTGIPTRPGKNRKTTLIAIILIIIGTLVEPGQRAPEFRNSAGRHAC